MKRPEDLTRDKLSEEEQQRVLQLEAEIEKTFDDDPTRTEATYRIDLGGSGYGERIWDEVIRRAKKAKWDASRRGLMVTMRCAPRR